MLLCAEKRGRFIPCRGGGTATTYYTDDHHVDEDELAIVDQGGAWNYFNKAGITRRSASESLTSSQDFVASRLIYLS